MTFIVVIAAVAALVWGCVLFARGGLVGGALLVLAAGAVFSYPFFHVRMGPIPVTVDRVLWLVLLGQYVVWRRLGRAEPKPARSTEWILLALIAVLAVSMFLHDWRRDGFHPLASLILYYVIPAGMYWVARQAAVSKRDVLLVFGVLAVFGVYLAVTAIAETHGIWSLVYPKYIATTTAEASFYGRGRGPFLNPSACGIFQGVCLCAMLMWWPRLGRVGKLLLPVVAGLACVGIYYTLTRSAWMGGFLGLLIVVGLAMPRTWRVPLVAGAALAASLLLATQWENLLAFKRDRGHSARETAESVTLRPILAVIAWKMFLDRPLLGHGFDQYDRASVYYLQDRTIKMPLEKARPFHQHNVFLALLVETGLLGMGAFAALLGLWARDAWRLVRAKTAPLWVRQQGLLFLALLANYLAAGMFQDVSIMAAVHMLLFFLAGVTAALSPWAEPATGPQAVPAEHPALVRRLASS